MIRTLHAAQDVTGESNEWYLPTAFCLGDPKEYEAFLDHYKLSYAEALLKRWNADPKSAPEKAVRVAVQVFQRQVAHTQETFDGNATDPGPVPKNAKEGMDKKSAKDDNNLEDKKKRARSTEKNPKTDDSEGTKAKLISDAEWRALEEGAGGKKRPDGARARSGLRSSFSSEIGEKDTKQPRAQGFDGSTESLKEAVDGILKTIAKDPQCDLRGKHNLWILKPSGTLMGSGIELCRTLKDAENLVRTRPTMAWVAQKYIENPLLVNGRKFDIRQWVLVTCRGENLEAYLCSDAMIRFAAMEYDDSSFDTTGVEKDARMKQLWMHLTNNCISKKHPDFNIDDEWQSYMWSAERFATWAKETTGQDKWVIMQEQMRDIVRNTLNAAVDACDWKNGYFQWLGYDFMIDANWRTWLLEVNHNPSVAGRTHVMIEQVNAILRDTPSVVSTGDETKTWRRIDWDPLPRSTPNGPPLSVVGRVVRPPNEQKFKNAAVRVLNVVAASKAMKDGPSARSGSLPAVPSRRRAAVGAGGA
jgi:tubulin monoglycylase TTLL3/8